MQGEKIYTIRITEAMEKKCGCPLCAIAADTENSEVERILGAAMMEPDVRIKTNEQGFCSRHLDALMGKSNKLSLALMLSTRLAQLSKELYSGCTPLLQKSPDPKKQLSALDRSRESCYLCTRIGTYMNAVISAFVYMYKSDADFDARLRKQPYICMKHTRALFRAGASLSREDYKRFTKAVNDINTLYAQSLAEDLDWFCKKFDYRYKDEDWKNAKDSVERAAAFLNK